MSGKIQSITAVLLYVISVGVGLAWWFVVWQNDVLGQLPGRGSTILITLGIVQFIATAILLLVLLQSMRGPAQSGDAFTLALTAALLFANLAWLVTPILGGPLILIVGILGLVCLYLHKRRSLPAH